MEGNWQEARMVEQTMRLVDLSINHLEQMAIIDETLTIEDLIRFVQRQVWTKKPIYHNWNYIKAVAHIAWNSTTKGKRAK